MWSPGWLGPSWAGYSALPAGPRRPMGSPGSLWGHPGGCIPAGIPSTLPPGLRWAPQGGRAPGRAGCSPLPPCPWGPQRGGGAAGLGPALPSVWASPSCVGKSALSAPISAPLCFPTGLAPGRALPALRGSRLPPCRGCPRPSPRPEEPNSDRRLWGGHTAGPGQPAATGWLQCWDFGRLTCCSRRLPRGLGVDFAPVPMSQGGLSPGCSWCQGAPSLKPSM